MNKKVISRPLHYCPKNNNIEPIYTLGDRIVESIVEHPVSSESEYWGDIHRAIMPLIASNKDFFAPPQWKKIRTWLEENSFRFYLNKKEFDALFDYLITSSAAMYDAFMGDAFPPNVPELCGRYLSTYYGLVNRLQEWKVLRDDFVSRSQFFYMLKTGYQDSRNNDTSDISTGLFFRFFSPVFLEEIRIFYSFIDNDIWYRSNLSELNKEHIKCIYKDIICEKFNHLFFLEVTQLKDRYISTCYNIEVPKLINRDDLSSIEPIRPVRWIDKIKAYVENIKRSGKDQQDEILIKVAAIGYVYLEGDGEYCYSQELNMFFKTLSKIWSEELEEKYKFEINIFPNSKDEYFKKFISFEYECVYFNNENNISVNVKFVDYSKFFSLRSDNTNIFEVIKEHNIVLLEDVPNIYTHEYKLLKRSGKDFPDNVAEYDYESEYNRMDFKNEEFLVLNYKYAPINLLTSKLNLISMNENTYGDTLKYNLAHPFIEFLKHFMASMEEDDQDRYVYIFTSKKSGVVFSDYAQDNFTREERYNAKSFYLITLSNRESKELSMCPGDRKKTFIVFSLWNMLKNIDYSFVENEAFYKDILHCEKEEACALAMKIYIKMNWDLPNNKFLFEICFDPKLKQRVSKPDGQKLEGFLKDLFKIIFSSKRDLFTRCVRRSFLNAVYSQMEYIEDAVFYCVLYNGFIEGNEPSVDIRFADFKERYVYSVNQPIFWNLTSILKLLNENVLRGDWIWEIRRIYEINKGIFIPAGLDGLNVLLQYVMETCEKYGYINSNIYRNLVSLLT